MEQLPQDQMDILEDLWGKEVEETNENPKDEYIDQVKERIEDMSDAGKISYLLGKVKYWYRSAIDWRKSYYKEFNKNTKEVRQ